MASMLRVIGYFLIVDLVSQTFGCSLRATRNLQTWEFDYSDGPNGPATWADPERNNSCGGKAQSPVNIPNVGAFNTRVLGNIDPFGFVHEPVEFEATRAPVNIEFQNMGATVELLFEGLEQKITGAEEFAKILGRHDESLVAGQEDEFTLDQLHFHWGVEDNSGSEHSYDGKHFPMEMHLVHYNSGKYPDLTTAAGYKDGVLVVGVMFELEENSSSLFTDLEPIMSNETFFTDDKYEVEFDFVAMTEQLNTGAFYLYAGSLTTPPCTEVVTWVLLKQPLSISSEDLEVFRSVERSEGEPMSPNFRPLQNGNGRTVFDIETQMAATIGNVNSAVEVAEERRQKGMVSSVASVAIVGVLLVAILVFMQKSKGEDK